MPVGWFIAPYKRRDQIPGRPGRYCAMDDHTPAIRDDGGRWAESECLGDAAVVKVRANRATLEALAAAQGIWRFPKDELGESLADIGTNQRDRIMQRIEELGYTRARLRDALGDDLRQRTLREVVRFVASERRLPRYDTANDRIVLDGPLVGCRSIDELDAEV